MRKGNFYLGAFVALAMGALAGCSKDDGESAKVTPDMTTSFANISIVMPDHTGTRAEGDEQAADTKTEPPKRTRSTNCCSCFTTRRETSSEARPAKILRETTGLLAIR